jgi:hypothetical protein
LGLQQRVRRPAGLAEPPIFSSVYPIPAISPARHSFAELSCSSSPRTQVSQQP